VLVKDKLHPDVPAWEVEIPQGINIDPYKLDYKLQDGSLFKKITTRFENHNEHLKQSILDLLDVNYIKQMVPEYNTVDIRIFKDLPGFKLVPHCDVLEHKAFIMFNLIDNVNSTTFYDKFEKLLCEAPNKKYTGIFHLLHTKPRIMHAIENKSKVDRYTTIAFIK
tara:strand:+ start:886 stop:1380 length:495 start_codon:yes stop_codon:yes gene_type:complete